MNQLSTLGRADRGDGTRRWLPVVRPSCRPALGFALGVWAAFLWLCAVGEAVGVDFPGPDPGPALVDVEKDEITLHNKLLSVSWRFSDQKMQSITVTDGQANGLSMFAVNAFVLTLDDGRVVKAADLQLVGKPQVAKLTARPQATRLADRQGGRQITATLTGEQGNLRVDWKAVLRDGSNYVRQLVTLQVRQKPAVIKNLKLIDLPYRGARVAGSVAGSPVVAGNMFFAYEHPNSRSQVGESDAPRGAKEPSKRIQCSLDRNMPLKPGQPLVQSSVIGVAPEGQLRRAFLYYIERERPRPYKPFLHYNSWYDIAWADRKMNEKQCLAVIEAFGRDLTEKRGVALDSFVFDDGWDDNQTLWGFHPGFPDGFTPLAAAAKKYRSAVGVWLSPWGGYGRAKAERMKYGKTQGFETNRNGFSLAGPKYYARFRDVCTEMIRKYDVNYFKFDGVGIGNNRRGAGVEFLPDIEGLLRLTQDLRRLRPDVYLSLTTGTWPSPYWLLWGDSIWRNGADCGFHGAGSMRQQWITYRDMITYRMIVRRAPLYPINSLMVQGICYARLGTATRMKNDLKDVVDEIRMLFACGTQLQELYVTPGMMTPPMWDALAEAAAWSRSNADVLVDVHWIGGDPGEGQPYGYASWSPRKGILALRNPGGKRARMTIDVETAFELPEVAARRYVLRSPWKGADRGLKLTLEAGRPHTFELTPFQALVLEVVPAAGATEQAQREAHQREVVGRTEEGTAIGRLLAGDFGWTVGPPKVVPLQRPGDTCYSVKDPTILRYDGRWHLFCSIRGEVRSHQVEYISFADWKDAGGAKREVLQLTDGYFCAPQVFYFTPQKKWCMILQVIDKSRKPALQPACSTTSDIADPASWSKPKTLFAEHPENVRMWIDFWVICDQTKAHLFFTSLNGQMWRAETSLADFPSGWSKPAVVLRGDIFEASHTYRLKGLDKYLTVVEAQVGGRRYYKAYLAERLDGQWKPVAATREKPFAAPGNVRFTGRKWTDSFSHGEMIRAGYDEKLEVDPAKLRFIFQGVLDKDKAGKPYGRIPWRLGLLEAAP